MILFADLNPSLVKKVSELNLKNLLAVNRSVFDFTGIIVTASNPKFVMSGGLDYQIGLKYPYECLVKKTKGGGNDRIGSIIFTITVNQVLEATEELVREAIRFALDNHGPEETLLLTGLGTGIGGLDEDVFCRILEEEINKER